MPFNPEKNEPTVGDATGEFLPEKPRESDTEDLAAGDPGLDAGGATGEFLPKDSDRAAVDESAGGATGEVLPVETGERNVAGATGSPYQAATGDYRPEDLAESSPTQARDRDKTGAHDATGEYHVDDSKAPAEFLTSRPRGHVTSPAALGGLRDRPAASPGERYVFQKLAGKGGMGEVWLADDTAIGRPVALKRMLRGREDQKDRFVQEAQVTGQLEHPGVIPVHEVGVDNKGQPYYVMKFVRGRTLQEVINDYHDPAKTAEPKEVQVGRLLNIFLNLCQTVAYAHSRGVIHRDLKPDNVMVGAYGETLVLDWGLAKVVGAPEDDRDPYAEVRLSGSEELSGTIAGSIKGTPTYFSPEAASGRVEDVDQASDIYLLGGTLYHILTGRPPRRASKVRELIEMARNQPPEPPRKLKPETPKPLDAICMRAMAHQKQDRYPSATALVEDMQRYLAGETVSAYRETLTERAWRWAKRHHKTIARTAAAALLVGTALTAYVLVQDAERRREDAVRVAQRLENEDKARGQVKAFRALAEEARFYAALADQMTDQTPVLDVAKALDKGRDALKIADAWGSSVKDLPLDDLQPQMKKELYDLSVELAQVLRRQPGEESNREAITLLDRAASLQAPTQSLHRLRGHFLESQGYKEKAAVEARLAESSDVGRTALDHYLTAEQLRRDSLLPDAQAKPADDKEAKTRVRPGAAKLARAMEEYRRALALDPEHYWSHFQLGACYLGLGQPSEAAEALGACVALRPRTPWGYSSRALALAALKRFDEALADLEQSLTLAPDFRPALLYRGIVYWQQKNLPKAHADLESALTGAEDARIIEAAFVRGQVYLEQHQYDKALADFEVLMQAKVTPRATHLHRARIYLAQEKAKACIESVTAYLTGATAPPEKDAKFLEALARELRTLTSELPVNALKTREFAYGLILEQIEKGLKGGVSSPALYGELGGMEELLAGSRPKEALKRLREAIAAYGEGLKLDPKNVKLRVKRGWAHVTLNQHDKAREDFQAAVVEDPAHAEAHTGLGYAEAQLKGPAAARRHAVAALLHGAGDHLILHNVACIYAVLSEKEPARKDFQDLALDHLERAVGLWVKGGKVGPNAIRLIEGESAFSPALRARPEFKKMVETAS